jgi:hypothetical protein
MGTHIALKLLSSTSCTKFIELKLKLKNDSLCVSVDIAGLHPQCPDPFATQFSVQVSQV